MQLVFGISIQIVINIIQMILPSFYTSSGFHLIFTIDNMEKSEHTIPKVN